MDREALKNELEEIVKIVEVCPKELQEKCFELLLADYLARERFQSQHSPSARQTEPTRMTRTEPHPVSEETLPPDVARRMRTFASQFSLSVDAVLKVYQVDELGNVNIEATDLKASQNSKRQRRLALLLGGKHQFQQGSFDVPTEELRELCVTYGAYDAANFMTNMKNAKEILAGFRPDATNKLSPTGKAELGSLLKEITS